MKINVRYITFYGSYPTLKLMYFCLEFNVSALNFNIRHRGLFKSLLKKNFQYFYINFYVKMFNSVLSQFVKY